MAKRHYFYQDLSWPELRDIAATDPVVVLPVGTTEQHGPHLPLATDYLSAGAIARSAVEQVYPHALVMEAVPYSFNEAGWLAAIPGWVASDTSPCLTGTVAMCPSSTSPRG